MRMTDLVSGMNLTTFPIIGLVIFGLVFAVIALRVLTLPAQRARHAAGLPLEEGQTQLPAHPPAHPPAQPQAQPSPQNDPRDPAPHTEHPQ